jgi:hypothetical protein
MRKRKNIDPDGVYEIQLAGILLAEKLIGKSKMNPSHIQNSQSSSKKSTNNTSASSQNKSNCRWTVANFH